MTTEKANPRTIELYDTRRGERLPLEPINPGKVGMYVCGVTVYDLTHIGHARVYVFFDVVQRFLRYLGYDVTYVRNHTDVDDKIIKRANEKDEDPLELASRFIEEFDQDMGALGVESPDHEPKVSECIDEVIEMVETLVDKGYAYEADGDVFYRVEKFEDYGKLSKRELEDLQAGESGRTDEELDAKKENPFDFTLWKKSVEGEPAWESPWGEGRPGWHIECSVMSTKYLGPCFDIHGGGSDLIFPHHENEIAQSEAATDCKPTSHYWMHLGMVNVAERNDDGELVEEKMSKSLGNFWTTRDVLDRFDAEAIRYFLLTTHYRKPITYSLENLEEATQRVEYLYATLMRIEQTLEHAGYNYETQAPDGDLVEGTAADVVTGFLAKFENALANDFNTSKALAALGELAKVGNELTESSGPPSDDIAYTTYLVANHMRKAGRVLGILERPAEEALRAIREQKLKDVELTVEQIEEKIAARKEARATEDWEAADEIRDELVGHGIVLMDKDWGTIWRVK